MPSAGTFVNGDQQTRLISDLQLRVAKLESELKHVIELKRNTERRFNELVSETEPLRRREALLQGELASVKNLLEVTEKDVATYKNKYLELTKGLHQVSRYCNELWIDHDFDVCVVFLARIWKLKRSSLKVE